MSLAPVGSVSVVVAINPHDDALDPILAAWHDQAGAGDYEVVIVDDGSRPGVAGAVARHRAAFDATPVRHLRARGRGRAASNNAGVAATHGDLVVFCADDFRPSRGLVAAHRAAHATFSSPGVGIGPGCFDASLRADPFRRWLEDSGRLFGVPFPFGVPGWRQGFFYVGNASLRRSTFDAVGGFDERFLSDMADDDDFGARLKAAGIETHPVPRALAWHVHELTLEDRLAAMHELRAVLRGGERSPARGGAFATGVSVGRSADTVAAGHEDWAAALDAILAADPPAGGG